MRFGKNSLAAIAAATLVLAPVAAQAAPAAKSTATAQVERVGADRKDENKLSGGTGILIAVLAAAAIIAGILIAADNNSDTPTSP